MTASYRASAAAYYLRAWSADSGRLLWELAAPGDAPRWTLAQAAELGTVPSADLRVVEGAAAGGAADEGDLVVALLDQTVLAVPAATGRARWRVQPFPPSPTAPK